MRAVLIALLAAPLGLAEAPQLDLGRTQAALMHELGVYPPGETHGRRRGGARP